MRATDLRGRAPGGAGGRAAGAGDGRRRPHRPPQALAFAAEPVDVLAAVAGLPVVERFLESDPAGWEQLWQVNLRAPMLLTRALAPGMVERGWGRLVYVSSDSARAGAGGEAVYAAGKAGLLGFAKSVAREVAAAGVTANVVCPGPVDTERSRAHPRRQAEAQAGAAAGDPGRAASAPPRTSPPRSPTSAHPPPAT